MNVNLAPADTQPVVESAWLDQATWSETANRLKSDLDRWRVRAAFAGVVGAICETIAGSLAETCGPVRAGLALLGAVVLAVVPYVAKTKTSKDQVRQWVRARAASEALKDQIYRFLVGAAPYGPQRDVATFNRNRQEIQKKVNDLNVFAAAIEPPKKVRPLELTIDAYVQQRVTAQIDGYYLKKGRENAANARRSHDLEFGLGLLAVVMGALVSAGPSAGLGWLVGLGAWVAVVTTASAAVTAHLASARYDHAAIIYFGTANGLKILRDGWLADPLRLQQDHVDKFVDAVESTISSENARWLLDWTREERQAETESKP